jgi:hypothetical protein
MKAWERLYSKILAYRDCAPGKAVDCEAGDYADPAITTVWRSLFCSAVMFACVIELGHVCGWRIIGLSGHLACTSQIRGKMKYLQAPRMLKSGKLIVAFAACHPLTATCHFCSKGALACGLASAPNGCLVHSYPLLNLPSMLKFMYKLEPNLEDIYRTLQNSVLPLNQHVRQANYGSPSCRSYC